MKILKLLVLILLVFVLAVVLSQTSEKTVEASVSAMPASFWFDDKLFALADANFPRPELGVVLRMTDHTGNEWWEYHAGVACPDAQYVFSYAVFAACWQVREMHTSDNQALFFGTLEAGSFVPAKATVPCVAPTCTNLIALQAEVSK